MKIYTKNGDTGKSTLFRGKKLIKKSDPVFEVLGTFDELNAYLGFLSTAKIKSITDTCFRIQQDLLSLGAIVASQKVTKPDIIFWNEKVTDLEKSIDDFESKNTKLTNFILPGGSKEAVYLHMCRVICRRLERTVVGYISAKKFKNMEFLVCYLNRLSDLLFVMARYSNKRYGIKDAVWK